MLVSAFNFKEENTYYGTNQFPFDGTVMMQP
jgi:hypothetical protein